MNEVISTEKTLSKTLFIYNDLIDKFMKNELSPGTIIDRQALAETYRVSIAPVKDALLMLTQDGLIEIRSRSVTIVKTVKQEDIRGSMLMREAIESEAVRIICGKTIRDNYDRLLEEAKALDSVEDQKKYWKADVDFHRHLVDLTGCQMMIDSYRRVMNIGIFCKINSYFMNEDPSGRLNHVELLNSLLTEAPGEADVYIRAHLRSGKNLSP